MQTTGKGYIFDARYDIFNHTGLVESYKMMINKGVQNVDLTFAIDSLGKPLRPSYIDIGEGFKSVSSKIGDGDDVEEVVTKFVKSNKACIANLEDTALIVSGRFAFNFSTNEFLPDKSHFDLYLPKSVSTELGVTNTKGEPEPGILCEIVRKDSGLNTFLINDKVYDSYINNVLKYIRGDNTKTRVSYMVSRVVN